MTAAVATLAALRGQAGEPLTIPLTLPREARISLVVTDEAGRVVRELLHGATRAAGRHEVPWNGLDDDGQPAPAGTYAWKLLATQGLHTEYLFTLGSNQSPPSARWPGNHNGIVACAVDEEGLVLGTSCGESTPLAVKVDFTGKRLWTIPHWFSAWQGPIAAGAAGADRVFLLEQDGELHRVDGRTGEHQATWDVLWRDEDRGLDGDVLRTSLDMDARDDQVVIAFRRHDVLRWYDPDNGRVLDELQLPEPRAVSVGGDGRVYVLSGDRVVAVSRREREPQVVVPAAILPERLAADPRTGEILVWSAEPDARIRRYAADGRLLSTYGREGGRRHGRYRPADFRGVTDLATLPDGRFVVVEAVAPRRTAIFRPDGRLEREWYGGMMYANYAAPEPDDPERVWMSCSWGEQMLARVDWVGRQWAPEAIYRHEGLAADLIGGGWPYFNWVVRRHEGTTYLCRENDPAILEVDEEQGRLIPRLIGFNAFQVWRQSRPAIVREAMRRHGMQEGDSPFFVWMDRDRDGKAGVEELEPLGPGYAWGSTPWVAADLSYWKAVPAHKLPAARTCIEINPLLGWDGGIPRMGWFGGARHPLLDQLPPILVGASAQGLTRAADGSVFIGFRSQHKEPFRSWNHGRIAAFDAAGRFRWAVGRPARGTRALPGETKVLHRVLDPVHGCAVATDVEDSMVHVWDRDGLWVGRLMDDPDLDAAPPAAYEVGCENFGGATFVVPADCRTPGLTPGEVLYFGCTANNTPVYRITGWDAFERQQGPLVITPDRVARLREDRREREQRRAIARIPYRRGITLDGRLNDWPESAVERPPPAPGGAGLGSDRDLPALDAADRDLLADFDDETEAAEPLGARQVFIRSDDARADVYLAWDEDGLVAAFDVSTAAPWKSSNVNPTLAFQGGAAVDLNFGPELPVRDAPGAGDCRVVVAPVKGATTAVQFHAVAPDAAEAAAQPATYETGLGKVTFGHVAALPEGRAACRVKPDGRGYVVELRAPWPAAIEPRVGTNLRLDASLILADRDGGRSERRICWHAQGTADRMTHDTFTEATLRPAGWGEAVLEP